MAGILGFCRCAFLVICCSSLTYSAELVHFSNGFSLQADSHVQHGNQMQFSVGGGTLEFDSNQIKSIENLASPIRAAVEGSSPVASAAKPEVLISEAALSQGIDAAFVRSVAKVESGLRQASLSAKGAIGLMQLMPATAKQLGVDPLRPEQNAKGGAQYLRDLLIRYKGNSALALAAYNAGPGAIDKFKGIPPYHETRNYVVRVLQEYNRQRLLQRTNEPRGQQIAVRKTPKKPSATD